MNPGPDLNWAKVWMLLARLDLRAFGCATGHSATPLGGAFLVGLEAGIGVGVLLGRATSTAALKGCQHRQ